MSRPFILCADDFGLTRGVNAAILELCARGRLSAVSALVAAPAWIIVSDTTALLIGSTSRAGICVIAWPRASAAATGSTQAWGQAACPPCPFSLTLNWSVAAISGPGRVSMRPSAIPGAL